MITTYVLSGIFILVALWVFVPALYGLPSVPTRPERIRAALCLAELEKGEAFYDLGAGDGRTLIIAAREFGARATGIEIGPIQCLVCWGNALWNGVHSQVCVKLDNYYKVELSDADVVFVYATSRELLRLQVHLEGQLRDGARVVTIGSSFPDWEPAKTEREALIFLYRMPPQYVRTI